VTALTPRQYGAQRARELKAEQPITPEQAARVAQLVMTGVPQKRAEGKAPAA
jgi:hypothetical protein